MFFSNSTAFAIETEHATTAQRRNNCVGAEGAPGDGGLIESGRDGSNVCEYPIRELSPSRTSFRRTANDYIYITNVRARYLPLSFRLF